MTPADLRTICNLIGGQTKLAHLLGMHHTLIPEAYGDKPGVMRASLLKAMAEWIKRYPDTDRKTMVATLQNIDLDDLEKDARAYRAIDGKSTPDAFMSVIERKYKATKRAA